MNKIRLQDLTPDVYYSQSRDFQFIGRLFDVVLNSVKANTENLYNLQLNENTDEKLIDLMTLTLGFKSKHQYNIKQLISLCSAFSVVIKNKGNINSIILAVNALLNAEGISESMDYSFSSDYTELNLFIPQTLTDTNLLKDLLVYILPAGMSCNIIKEFQISKPATTDITTKDEINNKWIKVNTDDTSIIARHTDSGIALAMAGSTPGLLANSDIYKPTPSSDNNTAQAKKTTRKRRK